MADAHAPDYLEVLERLRLLPDVWPRPTPIWVPRRVREQVAAIFRACIDWAVLTAGAPPDTIEAEAAHRLLRVVPQLLLRRAPGQSDVGDEDSPDKWSPGALAVIRSRLRQARAADWISLVQDALDDLAATAPAPFEPPAVPVPRAHDPAAPLTAQSAQAAVLRARTGALRSAAAQLTGNLPVPPSDAAVDMVASLFPQPLDAAESAELDQALEAARSVDVQSCLRATPRLVGRQLHLLKPAAGPGPSGFRNSHILCLAADPAGHFSLQAWADVWAQGSISPWLASLWSSAIARPFWKNSHQMAVRPILCGEALLKFAMGVCVLGAEKQIQKIAGRSQFGIGNNPEQLVAQVRAAAALRPHRALLSLDFKNAFGSVRWATPSNALPPLFPVLQFP